MDVFESLWSWGVDLIYKILPVSPFQPYLEQLSGLPFLGYLNWFFPVEAALKVMATWLTVIITWYTWQVLLRWLKVIGD